MMKRTFALWIILFALTATAQQPEAQKQLAQYVHNTMVFNRLFPQEKVYLHFDNTGYFREETIWFKAYVWRADNMKPTNISRVLYVELLDPNGDILETKKLRIDSGQAYGDIKLDKPCGSGFYEIRAYTRYMTNWDKNNCFSRVFPIFARLEQPGRYDMNIRMDEGRMRLPGYEDLLAQAHQEVLTAVTRDKKGNISEDTLKNSDRNAEKVFRKRNNTDIRFYPEGGNLVEGLESRVAFAILAGDTATNTDVFLLNARGDTLSTCHTLREGRGFFFCRPDSSKLYLALPGKKLRLFPLPKVETEGCVIRLNTQPEDRMILQVTATPSFRNELLGLSLQHNGQIVKFDSILLNDESLSIGYDRAELPVGVSQLTLFNREGRILAERLFFIAPHDTLIAGRINVHTESDAIAPYRKMALTLSAAPESSMSLSIMDRATCTNGSDHQNITSYLLLSSDLKGYIHRPDYYFEKDDATHRLAADLLTLVQGWRRYNWRMMAGLEPFVKKQPIEDRLYLDGQLRPIRKKKTVKGIDLSATLFNREGNSLQGEARTDSTGYYAFHIPNCNGDWDLYMKTTKNGSSTNCRITIDRQFSPEQRQLSFYELRLTQPDRAHVVELKEAPKEISHGNSSDIHLKEAKVKDKKKMDLQRAWSGIDFLEKQDVLTFYDCDAITDRMKDRGEEIPNVLTFLLQKKYFSDCLRKRSYGVIWNDNIFHENYARPYGYESLAPIINGSYVTPVGSEIPPPIYLDDVKTMYVYTINIGQNNYWGSTRNYIIVELFPHYKAFYNQKGLRRTHFEGFNVPETFQMNDYDLLPQEDDFRRTLYWNPDVRTDKNGKASVTFWNNSTCRKFMISAEGITKEGKPICY